MKKKLLALFLVLVMVMSVVPTVSAEGASFDLQVTPSVTEAQVGDTVYYTVTANGTEVSALSFELVIPEGMTYVPGSAAAPSNLASTLGWFAAEWTEAAMLWTGFNFEGTDFPKDLEILTFACTVDATGSHKVGIGELVVSDGNIEEMDPSKYSVNIDPVTVPAATAGAYLSVDVKADATEVNAGATVNYTVIANGADVSALSFVLEIPEGMTYVPGSAVAPSNLASTLGWFAAEWTESAMLWTGFNFEGTDFPKDLVILTFSCTVDTAGSHKVGIGELVVSDGNIEEMDEYTLNIDTVTVAGCDHVFTNYVSNNDATCTADGTKTASCDKGCGETNTVTDEGTALGHAFTNYVSDENATCTADGTKTAACDNGCGETKTVTDEGTALGHSFTNYISDENATCTADGTKTAACDNGCGETKTIADEDTALGHDWADATCTDAKTCTRCGETEGEALGHSFTNYVSDENATCTADGTKTAACDNGCGETNTVTDEGTALGHSFTNYISDENATCTADGTKTAACDNGCGETKTIADEGTAMGHDWADATCTEPKTCKRCGETEGEALGHSFGEYVSDENATCTENGTKTATCATCGDTDTVEDEGTALGHDWVDATCTEAKTCARCGETEGEALGHTVEYVSNNDATCTEDGTKTGICSVCNEEVTVTDEGTALNHELTEVAATVTCTEAGHTGYYACTRCDAWFEDATGSVEITDKDSVNVDALGHIDEDEDYLCDRCGAELPKEPSEEPTEKPSEPSEEPSEPSDEPTEKPSEPTDKPATPDEPAEDNKPTQKPDTDEENKQTGDTGMTLYVAMMVVALFGLFGTVILGKKKFMI